MSFRRSAVALCAAVATGLSIAPAHAALVDQPIIHSAPGAALSVNPIGSYETGVFDASAAEIVTYHASSQRVLTVNARSGSVDILDISDPTAPEKIGEVSGGAGTSINSVAVRADGLAVATVEPPVKTDPGSVIFFDAAGDGSVLGSVQVGSLPDMVTITGDGGYALVANEGEPAEDYTVDPEGSVSVITLPEDVAPATEVRTAGFGGVHVPEGVRVFGQVGDSTTVAQNLEPEYVTTSDGKAYVSLQENNAIAVIDIATATVDEILPLGTVDLAEVPMDISDRDGGINLRNWPIQSFRLPDAIESYAVGGTTYIVTANEGDARDWDAYSEEARIRDLGEDGLAPICAGYVDDVAAFQLDENAGRLKITTADGLNEDEGCYGQLHSYGGRGFSIFDQSGDLVFNSDDDFERILAEAVPGYFNSDHGESAFEGRSDDKGPEPEGVALGEIGGRTYAFIGLERIGGVMVYDVTDPSAAEFVTYVNNRDFSVSMEDEADRAAALPGAGDLGPEGLKFIPASDAPGGENLLVVGNEVSGTTTIFQVDEVLGAVPSAPGLSSLSSR